MSWACANGRLLRRSSCSDAVGVDVNTASAPLLSRVSGIGEGLANNIVTHRDTNGPFRSRQTLKEVSRLRPKAFEQCAGSLRTPAAATIPLTPPACTLSRIQWSAALLRRSRDTAALIGNRTALDGLNPEDFIDDTIGLTTVSDILKELEKPGRDPRPRVQDGNFQGACGPDRRPHHRHGSRGRRHQCRHLGAFIDIGAHQDGLVHVSAISSTFVKDPETS